MPTSPLISVVVPTYNCYDRMAESLQSLEAFAGASSAEVVFVDDASSDGTYTLLQEWVATRPFARVDRLPRNSGSAATPRNRGMDLARGRFVYFHDADDILIPDNLAAALRVASELDCDAVRGPLIVRHGSGAEVLADQIPQWDAIDSEAERLRAITRHQSLTCSFIMRRALLVERDIKFDPGRRIGEDIVFTSQVLAASERTAFHAEPLRVYVRAAEGQSVTQRITSHQFADFVRAWQEVEEILSRRGVSFVKEHGKAAILYAVRQFIWFGTEELTPEDFQLFSDYCRRHWDVIAAFDMAQRFREVLVAAYEGDAHAFADAVRLRLLVAGHDLKFIEPLYPVLQSRFTLRTDQWQGHEAHDPDASQQALRWADLVWVEWLLGAAVWYSQRVTNNQRLIIRTHRSEMTVDYGDRVDLDKVSAFVAVAPHTLGAFADRFDIPREKFWLIPNAFDVDAYDSSPCEDKFNRISMIGIVPRLKGFKRAIRLLSDLRSTHPDVQLWTYGRQPEELDWLMRSDEERAYYEECRQLVDELGLQDAIHHQGWADTREEIHKSAFVLSLSDYEGMQVAVGEAYCGSSLGLTLAWPGARDCYPQEFVFDTADEMLRAIRSYLDDRASYDRAVARGRSYIREHYDLSVVGREIEHMVNSLRA